MIRFGAFQGKLILSLVSWKTRHYALAESKNYSILL